MLGYVTRLVADRGDATEPSETVDGSPAGASTHLFECPDCESVYISEELAICSSCDVGVEAVPTERDLEHVSPGDGF